MKNINRLFILMAMALLMPFVGQAQSFSYSCNFNDEYDSAGWVLLNGSQANYWCIGTPSGGGSRAMFITNTDTATNTYNTGSTSIVYAYREVDLTEGSYVISYDWRAYGESSYDYLRVFLVPSSATLTAGLLPDGTTSTYSFGNTVPSGWIPLDGASRLNSSSTWNNYTCEFNVSVADTYKLAFMWCNDASAGTNPPGAVDNIVFMQPTCPTPVMPRVENLTTTSFDFSWTDNSEGYASVWVVEIDSANQTHGQGTIYTATDTVISFSGLTPNTVYTLWVYAICSGSDTSMALRYQMQTPCTFLTTLPYYQDFESTVSGSTTSTNFVDCWKRLNDPAMTSHYPYVSSSSTYSHNGGIKGLYWYNTSTFAYQSVALPGIDTDYFPMRNLQLSFWARLTGSGAYPEFEVGVMSDPSDINSFVSVATVTVNTTDWEQYVVSFANYTGTGRFMALKCTGSVNYWYAALDEFRIEPIPPCYPVYHLAVSNTGTTGTRLSWDVRHGRSSAATFQVRLDSVGAVHAPLAWMDDSDTLTNPIRFSTTEPFCLATGLEPGVTYRAIVRAICDNDSLSGWDSVIFTTNMLPCAVSDPTLTDTLVFSTGTNQVSSVPVQYSWGNTLCQSIYTASELVDMGLSAGMITGLDYSFSNNSTYEKLFSIYITSTDHLTYSSSSDMVTVRAADLVYGPATHSLNTSGTVHYTFSTPFQWDGSSNIVITTMMNQPNGASHSTSQFYGYSTAASGVYTVYRYQDGTQFTPANSTGGNAGTSSYRPSITFYTMGCIAHASCAAPTIIMDRVESDTVAFSWIPGYQESSWDIMVREVGATLWDTLALGYTGTNYVISTLSPMHNYQLRLVPDCGGDSVWAQTSFNTPCVPVETLPFHEDFESFIAASTLGSPITNCWHRGTNYSYTSYPYLSTSYSNSGTHSMYFYNSGSTGWAYLALPAMSVSVDSLQVSFAAMKTSSTYSLQVGVMSDPEDFSTFSVVATISPNATNTWEMFEVPLSGYEGNGQYIAIAAAGSSYNYMYLDDIEVTLIPNCPRPGSFTFTNVTTTNATVAWVDTSTTNFEIEYGVSGFAQGTGTVVTSSLNSITLYGLNHSTRYDVYVRGICALGDTSNWSFRGSFITECGIIDQLPYSQNFSGWGVGTSARPACWACGGYSSYPYLMNVTDNNGLPIRQTLYMYSYSANRVYASLPELDSVSYPVHLTRTIFSAWTNSTSGTYYSHDLIVGVCSNPGDLNTFTAVDTVTLATSPMEYEVSFESAIGAGKYITFVSTATNGASYNYAYLDSVAVEIIPDCVSPNNLAITAVTANTATVGWNDRAYSGAWEVEYTLHGFGIGSGTRVVTTSNPITVTGLLPSSQYDFYVRSICNVGDTSEWCRTPCVFNTLQNPATVPYFYDMETSVEWDNWQFTSNSPITWYRGTAAGNGTNGSSSGTQAMYISADTGLTCSTHINEVVNAVAYRDIDFGNIDSTYLLSFRASAGGCRVGNSVYDGLAVFMVDPATPLQPSSGSPLVSPWGSVNDLTLLTTVYCQPGWNTYTAILDTLTGIHRLVFYWFNQNTTSIGTFLGAPAAVDDISIQYMSCPRPAGIHATHITMASVNLTWHGQEDGDYRVTLRAATGATVASDVVHTNSVQFTGLTPGTSYVAYVRRLCEAGDSSLVPTYSFTTLLCNSGSSDTVGSTASTTTSYNIPVNNYYSYSYTQQLVLASELSGSGEISAINFYYTGTSNITNKAGCTIYLAHTSLSSFSSYDDMIDPSTMTMVYTGNFNCQPGWNQMQFNNPFHYDGTRNLVIAIDDNSGSYSGTAFTFRTSPATAQMALTLYSDSENPDCSSLASLAAFSGARDLYGYRNVMFLEMCPPNDCALPILRDPIVRSTNVTLRWRNTGTTYNVGYRLASSSSWISNNITTTDTFYTINSVYPMTDYVYHVRQHCDTNGVSNWAEDQFNSSDVPCLSPMNLQVDNITNNKAKLTWTPEENNTGYRLRIYNSYYDQTYVSYLANKTVTGLESNTRYYAAVRAICQGFDEPSEWSDPISFVTDVCPDATDLTATNVQGNSVDLDWVDGGRAISWIIEYGNLGFDAGTGVPVEVDHHPFTLTGLTGETTYDIYVRAVCGTDFLSENWSNRVTITTEYSDIRRVSDDARVSIFPNPTSADAELLIPATVGDVLVEVIDMSGRTQLSYTLPTGTERVTLSTSDLPQGAYYVRVTGSSLNSVKKLIVR